MNPVRPHPGRASDPLGVVAGTVAQEIGSALTAIQVAAERLERRSSRRGRPASGPDSSSDATSDPASHATSGEERSPELRLILEQSHRLARLARSLVELARPSRTDAVPVALCAEVERLLPAVRRVLAREGVELEVEGLCPPRGPAEPGGSAAAPPVRADPAALQEILLALVNNARTAVTRGAGPRWIRLAVAHLPGGGGEIRIEDSGPGVTPGAEERIFLPLVSEWGGEGMGLSRSRLVLAGLGGELRLVPSRRGGAEFILTLEPYPEDAR